MTCRCLSKFTSIQNLTNSVESLLNGRYLIKTTKLIHSNKCRKQIQRQGVHALNKPFIKTLSKDELKLFQILSVIISKINVKTHYAGYLLLMIQFEGQRDSQTKLQIENVVAFDRAKYCPIGLLNSKATNFSCRYFLVFTQSNYYYSLKVLSLI